MVYVALLLVLITILICFIFFIKQKIILKYKLKANFGFLSLYNFSLFINNHWSLTIQHVQLQFIHPFSFSLTAFFIIRIHIRGVTLRTNKKEYTSSLFTKTRKNKPVYFFSSFFFSRLRHLFQWLHPTLQFLFTLPFQWFLFFMNRCIQIKIQDITWVVFYLQNEKDHYCLQIDSLDCQSILNVMMTDETSLSLSSSRYTLKQTQHMFLKKQINLSIVLHSLQFNIISSSSTSIPILSKTNGSINIFFNLASDCFTLYSIHCDILFDDFQTHLYPISNNIINNSNQNMADLLNNKANDKNQVQNNLLNKLSTWHFLTWTIKSSKLGIMHDFSNKNSMIHTRWEIENLYITYLTTTTNTITTTTQKSGTQKCDLKITMDSILYQLKEDLVPDVTMKLFYTSNVLMHAILSHHKTQPLHNNNSMLQFIFNLSKPQLTIDVTKHHILKLWIQHIKTSFSSTANKESIHNDNKYKKDDDNTNNTINHDQLQALLPMMDLSLVLLSPSIQFIDHSLKDISTTSTSTTNTTKETRVLGSLECTSIRCLIAGEYESKSNSSLSSLSTTTALRRKRSSTLIKRISSLAKLKRNNNNNNDYQPKVIYSLSSSSCTYKMTFWLNIDEMYVKYLQPNSNNNNWIPFLSSKHLDLAFNIQFIPSIHLIHPDNIRDGEIQATMEQSDLYICNNILDIQPIVYWINLLQPLLTSSSIPNDPSLHFDTSSSPPKKVLAFLKIYQRFTANISLLKTTIIIIGKHNKQLEGIRPPHGYLDNTPTFDMVTSVRLCIEKISLEYAKASNNQPSSSTPSSLLSTTIGKKSSPSPPYELIGTLRFSFHQIVLDHFTSTSPYLNDNSNDDDVKKKYSTIAWISRLHINFSTFYHQHKNRLFLSTDIKLRKYGMQFSLNNYYAILLAFFSFLQLIKQRKQDNKQDIKGINEKKNKNINENSNSWIIMDKIQFQVYRCDIKIFLPNEYYLFFRLDDTMLNWHGVNNENNQPCITIANMTLFGASPSSSGYNNSTITTKANNNNNSDNDHVHHWEILTEIDDIEFLINHQDNDAVTKTIDTSISKLFIRIPYQYQFSNIVDNVINLLKGIRELDQLVLNHHQNQHPYFTYFGPVPRNTLIVLPTIKLQSDQVIICLDDDPLEAKLRKIFSVGQAENVHRLVLEEEFEKEEKRFEKEKASSIIHYEMNHPKRVPIDTARQRLNELHSSSWIKTINQCKQAEYDHYDRLRQCDYRYRCLAERLDEAYDDSDTGFNGDNYADMFRISILPFSLQAPLSQLTLKDSSLTITQDTFSMDDKTVLLFIHNMGNHVPMNSIFSFLIPFQFYWQAGETIIKIRDYPLPLLSIPSSSPDDHEQDQHKNLLIKSPSWSLSGKYVIADDIGVKEGSRQIPLNIVNNSNDYNHDYNSPTTTVSPSPLYTIHIVRTASPTKFYSQVDYKVYTSATCMLCWSISYQPAIQDIITILESLTPMPVDPSPKIGFWDKIRLMIHTKTKISFIHPQGEFAFIMKGTRDPYLLLNHGAGMAKYWKGQVVWYLGYDNPQKEFIQIQSQYYTFGVPDLIRSIRHCNNNNNDNDSLTSSSSSGDNIPFIFTKIVIKLSGGVQMGIGCHLERLCSSHCQVCQHTKKTKRCQFLFFKPHYQVVYKTKDQVDVNSHDAYAGFRSDYIHLSISIIKISSVSSLDNDQAPPPLQDINAMHLSPQSIQHFLQWYSLFGGPLSLPVRRGSLFKNEDEVRVKFGQHMQSMKYKIMMEPMAFGYFCMVDEQQNSNSEDIADIVGLKANFNQFCLDIHQRRKPRIENTTKASISSLSSKNNNNEEEDYELYRVKSNWPLHEIEIHLKEVDLRAIYTTNTTVSPKHPSYYYDNDENKSHHTATTYSNKWTVDLDDFVELGYDINPSAIASSSKVLPFAFSPCVDYIKVLDPLYVEKNYHLKKTHACIIGSFKNTWETQLDYLHQRMELIEDQIRRYQQKLEQLEHHLAMESYNINLSQQERECISIIDRLYIKKKLLEQYIEKIWETSHQLYSADQDNTTSYQLDKSLMEWEELMGRFKERYIIHNPQIIWTTAVQDIVSRWRDARSQHYIHSYNISSRATQFLRELVEKCTLKPSQQQQQQQHDRPKSTSFYFESNNQESTLDSYAPNDLLNKLMNDRENHFIVTDETGETETKNKTNNNYNTNNFNPLDNDKNDHEDDNEANVENDPKYQVNQIPEGCTSENMTLIDLWNPQIFLQSNELQDSGILVANQRIQIKQFEVIETDNTDVDTSLLKKRTVASMESIQLFIVNRASINIVDLLIDNHYGVPNSNLMDLSLDQHHQSSILSAWIPPEMFVNNYIEEYYENRFERFGNQSKIKGTIQYDRYNPIRSTTTTTMTTPLNGSRSHHHQPWDDQCNSTHLHFTNFSFTANQHQYRILYQVVVSILLFKKSASYIDRTNQLQDIAFSLQTNGESPLTILNNIIYLQEKVRHYSYLNQYYQYQHFCIQNGIDNNMVDFTIEDAIFVQQQSKQTRRKWHAYKESLFLLTQSSKEYLARHQQYISFHNNNKKVQENDDDRHEQQQQQQTMAIGKINISIKSLIWNMQKDEELPFSQWILENTNYHLTINSDQSHHHTFEVDKLLVKNTSPDPVFQQVVGPFIEGKRLSTYLSPYSSPSSSSSNITYPDFSRQKMISGRLVSLKPVGGIPIIQHLEINLFPLQLQLTQTFWQSIVMYLFSTSLLPNSPSTASFQTPSITTATTSQYQSPLNNMQTSKSSPLSSTASTSSLSSIHFARLLCTSNNNDDDDESNLLGTIKGKQQQQQHNPSNSSKHSPNRSSLIASQNETSSMNSDTGIWFGGKSLLATTSCLSTNSQHHNQHQQQQQQQQKKRPPSKRNNSHDSRRTSWIAWDGSLSKITKLNHSEEDDDKDDLVIMKQRASNNCTFILIKIPSAKHCLSFKGNKQIYDLQNFKFRQPNLEYRNKTWSWYDLLNALKKDFLKAVIRHSPSLIKEKLLPRRLLFNHHENNESTTKSTYSSNNNHEEKKEEEEEKEINYLTKTAHIYSMDEALESRISFTSQDIKSIEDLIQIQLYSDDEDDESTFNDENSDNIYREQDQQDVTDENEDEDFEDQYINDEDSDGEHEDLFSLHSNDDFIHNDDNENTDKKNKDHQGTMEIHQKNTLFEKTVSRWISFKKGKGKLSDSLNNNDTLINNEDLEKGRILFGKSYRQPS
ncbi:unnamed protein product [Cunninghamella echinulata]